MKINECIDNDIITDYGNPRLKKQLDSIKEIKDKFEEIKLKNPRFLNEERTELPQTKAVCEKYEEIKKNLLVKFKDFIGNLDNYNKKFEDIENDKNVINNSFEYINEIKVVKKKEVDFSSFKGFIFKSPYISLYKNEKKIETSYETFDFNLDNVTQNKLKEKFPDYILILKGKTVYK